MESTAGQMCEIQASPIFFRTISISLSYSLRHPPSHSHAHTHICVTLTLYLFLSFSGFLSPTFMHTRTFLFLLISPPLFSSLLLAPSLLSRSLSLSRKQAYEEQGTTQPTHTHTNTLLSGGFQGVVLLLCCFFSLSIFMLCLWPFFSIAAARSGFSCLLSCSLVASLYVILVCPFLPCCLLAGLKGKCFPVSPHRSDNPQRLSDTCNVLFPPPLYKSLSLPLPLKLRSHIF